MGGVLAGACQVRLIDRRIDFLVERASENGVKNLKCIYEGARAEFPMASEEKARRYAETTLRKLEKNKKSAGK